MAREPSSFSPSHAHPDPKRPTAACSFHMYACMDMASFPHVSSRAMHHITLESWSHVSYTDLDVQIRITCIRIMLHSDWISAKMSHLLCLHHLWNWLLSSWSLPMDRSPLHVISSHNQTPSFNHNRKFYMDACICDAIVSNPAVSIYCAVVSILLLRSILRSILLRSILV